MHVRSEEIPRAAARALAVMTASMSGPEGQEMVGTLLEEVIVDEDQATAAMEHALGSTAVAFTAVALLARAQGITVSEALAEVGVALAQRYPPTGT